MGFLWSINDVVYGNEEKDRKPVAAFIREVNNYPQWYQDTPIAQAIREQNQYGKVDSVSPIYDALNTNYQPLDGTSIYY